ncbi:NAD(P)H-binding protein [Catenulispora pinisilvae]|uniref:NAD(P)H-binding protein n=1 Tax=Catenulispora pinisilvae TaxID=2705253 RepID=UPI00189261D3|nr:NAD(P)H-binding protein [Catenulispora pinisilvae]
MILITGATGNVGRIVVERLAAEGREVRALSRRPEQVQWPFGTRAVAGDLVDAASLGPALDGVESVFLFAAPGLGADFVGAAQAAGVRRVVLLSSGAVDDEAQVQDGPIAARHHEIEQLLRASGMRWTFLRPDTFATNLLPWSYQTKNGDEIHGAYAKAAAPVIHEADIADAAVAALTGEGHDAKAYRLTGPELLTHADQARILGEVLGRPIRYVEIPAEQARAQMSGHVPAPILDDILKLWEQSLERPHPVSADVEAVTGHKARDFRSWAREHAEVF